MDVFSHAAWGATIIRKPPLVWWAALFGALPDILTSFFGLLKYRGKFLKELDSMMNGDSKYRIYFQVYYYTHSFIPITGLAIILYLIAPSYWIITIPYYLHILLDIFTHRGIWATRIFYPFSNFHFNGHDWWKNKWFSIGNWAALIVINLIIFLV